MTRGVADVERSRRASVGRLCTVVINARDKRPTGVGVRCNAATGFDGL